MKLAFWKRQREREQEFEASRPPGDVDVATATCTFCGEQHPVEYYREESMWGTIKFALPVRCPDIERSGTE